KQAHALLVNLHLNGLGRNIWCDPHVDIGVRVIEPVALREIDPFDLGVAAWVGVTQLRGGGERGEVGGSLRVTTLRDPKPDVDDDRADHENDGRAHDEENEHLATLSAGAPWRPAGTARQPR